MVAFVIRRSACEEMHKHGCARPAKEHSVNMCTVAISNMCRGCQLGSRSAAATRRVSSPILIINLLVALALVSFFRLPIVFSYLVKDRSHEFGSKRPLGAGCCTQHSDQAWATVTVGGDQTEAEN